MRRYQNKDGTLTPAGKKRRAKNIKKINAFYDRANNKAEKGIRIYEATGRPNKAKAFRGLVEANETDRRKKIAALNAMDAFVAFKLNREAFE